MFDLSENKYVKKCCMTVSNTSSHITNINRLDWTIKNTYVDNNIPIDWEYILRLCTELVRLNITEWLRTVPTIKNPFMLVDKVGMAANLLESFQNKYGCPAGSSYHTMYENIQKTKLGALPRHAEQVGVANADIADVRRRIAIRRLGVPR